jgi:hypothetical protein
MADTAVSFALLELRKQSDPLAAELADSLQRRIEARRGNVSLTVSLLGRGAKANNSTELNAVKYILIDLAEKLNLVPNPSGLVDKEPEVASKRSSVDQTELSMAERLQRALSECNEPSAPPRETNIENIIGRELDFLRATGQRGKILDLVYKALMSIPPTSVEAERAFSASGLFLTKLRSRLADKTLAKMTMLRYYFQHAQ